ncbi:MAG: hypothetical protein JRG89_10335, partial [Deltaproteobacteria bacterium]|nr:hypothetical protein [Deltaproteobacteria bacterium]
DYNPGQLDIASTKLALLGTTLFVTGAQTVSSSFFLSLFSIEAVSESADVSDAHDVSLSLNLVPPRPPLEAVVGTSGSSSGANSNSGGAR